MLDFDYGLDFFAFDLNVKSLVESLKNMVKRMDRVTEEMENIINGNGLSEKENLLLFLWRDLGNKTKFKNISLNELNDITFESKNRLFGIYLVERKDGKYNIILRYEEKDNRYKNKDNSQPMEINFGYYSLMKWLRKRNYLKKN